MQCRQKYNREGGESAEQEQVSNTRTPSPSKGDAILDFLFFCPSLRRNAFWVYYSRLGASGPVCELGIWVLEIE